MSCHKQHGPAAYCAIVEKLTGKKVTGDQWHEMKKMAAEAGLDTGRSKVEGKVSYDAAGELTASLMPEERWALFSEQEQEDLRSFHREQAAAASEADNTAGTIAVVKLMAENGVADTLAEADARAKAARAAKAGKEVPASTGKQGTDIPPLVAEIQQGRATYRFYAIDPATKARLETGFLSVDEALKSGQAFPSITTCIGALDKPTLVPWASGMAADYGDDVLRELQGMSPEERDAKLGELLEVDDKSGRTAFRKAAGNAYAEKRDTAAARGTEVHAIAEAIMRGENPEVPEELAGYVDAVKKFKEEYPDMKFLYTEATVYNPDSRTMGTTDAIVELGGRRYVLDYKTNKSAAVHSSTGMQLAAAANAKAIVHADGRQEPMPEVHGGIGVGLGPNGEMQIFKFDTTKGGANDEGFKAARSAWDWKYEAGKDPRPVSREQLLA